MIKFDIIYKDINELNIYRMKLLKILKEKDFVRKEQYNFVTSKLEICFINEKDYYRIVPIYGEILYKRYDSINDIIFEEIKNLINRIYETKEIYIIYPDRSWLSWNGNYKIEHLNEFEIKAIDDNYRKIFYNKESLIKYVNDSIEAEIDKKISEIQELKKKKM